MVHLWLKSPLKSSINKFTAAYLHPIPGVFNGIDFIIKGQGREIREIIEWGDDFNTDRKTL